MTAASKSFNLYRGHSIFRNQPSYTHFNKSFEDHGDALFLSLNEIHPLFLDTERPGNELGFHLNILVDPRTRQEVNVFLYDHTKETSPKLFQYGHKSTLSAAQQAACLRVLQAWQQHEAVDEADLLIWRRLSDKRCKELAKFQAYVADYAQKSNDRIYAPTKRQVELYKLWQARLLQSLLQQAPTNQTFNTHLGLPHVRICKGMLEQFGSIENVQLLHLEGWVRVLEEKEDSIGRLHCLRLQNRLESYVDLYVKSTPCNILRKEVLQQHLEADEIQLDSTKYFIPSETLLFLLTAGDYIDLPTECLLTIVQDKKDQQHKSIQFEKPLPARNCGWHTNKLVVEQAYAASLAMPGNSKWVRKENNNFVVEKTEPVEEIHALPKGAIEYKPTSFESYLENLSAPTGQLDHTLKSNEVLAKWNLKESETGKVTEILSTFQLPAMLNEEATQFLGSHSIKLEYKQQFGCEVMTKYELLEHWLQMQFTSACFGASAGKCLRIAANSFELVLEEEVTLPKVEHQLENLYKVKMPQLLANLSEFLNHLNKMPVGQYLLRYNAKFQDKLMLCAPSSEITQNTVFLHNLLQAESSDLHFMTQRHSLPIDDMLCTKVHASHKLIPGAFPPFTPCRKKQSKPPAEKIDDRQFIVKRLQQKKGLLKTKDSQSRKRKKNQRKSRKRSEKRQKLKEEAEHAKDMEADKVLFGF